MTVGMQLITMPRSPFEQREAVPLLLRITKQTTSATNAEVMDIGPERAERHTTAVTSELAEDLLCKKTNRDCFEVDNVENLNTFMNMSPVFLILM